MSKNSLEILFDSRTRLKILKFLFRNYGKNYTFKEVINHTQEDSTNIRRELDKLMEIGLIVEQPRKNEKKAKKA